MVRLKAGVIGTGSIGDVHLAGYASAKKESEVWAICDTNPARLAEMGEKYGVPPQRRYRDYRRMLEKEPLDVVSVCTPNVYHFEQANAALERGIATLVEKPMVLRIDQAQKLIATARRTQAKAMVAFSHRFVRMNIAAKKLIERGELGKPFMVRVRYAHGGPYPGWAQSDWFYKKRLAGGGALLDMGIHAIDICHYLIGPIAAVSAEVKTLRKPIEVDDNAVLTLDFGSQKCLGMIECGWTSPPGFAGIEIYGDEGSLTLDLVKGPTWLSGKTCPDGTTRYKQRKLAVPSGPSHWPFQMQQWIRYVLGKETIVELPGLEDGRNSLVVALAALESARKGKRERIRW
ncbi:MAG: Gfo/Idh/MocA family oxidoreductase [Candidatus Sumerlaeaceae bacterium]|nr:Gfo/Idh/MocA family oxidoreductase [Candidatus Sumerlaeaceae bacterium]